MHSNTVYGNFKKHLILAHINIIAIDTADIYLFYANYFRHTNSRRRICQASRRVNRIVFSRNPAMFARLNPCVCDVNI